MGKVTVAEATLLSSACQSLPWAITRITVRPSQQTLLLSASQVGTLRLRGQVLAPGRRGLRDGVGIHTQLQGVSRGSRPSHAPPGSRRVVPGVGGAHLKMKMKSMSSMQKVATLSMVFMSTTSWRRSAGMKRTSFSTRSSRKVRSTDSPPSACPMISQTLQAGPGVSRGCPPPKAGVRPEPPRPASTPWPCPGTQGAEDQGGTAKASQLTTVPQKLPECGLWPSLCLLGMAVPTLLPAWGGGRTPRALLPPRGQ